MKLTHALVPFAVCTLALSAVAAELPSRKPGLWDLTMNMGISGVPPRTMQQCIDAASDQALHAQAGMGGENCSKRDVVTAPGKITIDSICNIGGRQVTSHIVVAGSFDSAYTTTISSTGGLRDTNMTMDAKWLGPCKADQRPGDIIMSNGMKMNVLDIRKMAPPAR